MGCYRLFVAIKNIQIILEALLHAVGNNKQKRTNHTREIVKIVCVGL